MDYNRDQELESLRSNTAETRTHYGLLQDPVIELESEEESSEKHLTTRKILLTTVVIFSWISKGMAAEITGPTMEELLRRTGTGYEDISLAMRVAEVIRLVGCISMGFLPEGFRRYNYLQGGVGMLFSLVSMWILPRATNMMQLVGSFVALGISQVFITIPARALILDIWKERASAPMQCLHAAYGIGALLTPAVVFLFVPTVMTYTPSDVGAPSDCYPAETGNVSSNASVQHSYPIDEAYLTVNVITAVCAIALFVTQVLEHRRDDTDAAISNIEAERQKAKVDGLQGLSSSQKCLVGLAILLATAMQFQSTGLLRLYGRFSTILGLRHFCFSLQQSLSFATVYFIALTAGRVVFTFTTFLDNTIMLAVQITGVTAGAMCLLFVGKSSVTAAMLSMFLHGFFFGPVIASIYIWLNSLLYVKNLYMAIVNAAEPLGAIVYLFLIAILLQRVGPDSVLFLGVGMCTLALVITCLMLVLSCYARRKHASGKLLSD